MSKLLLSYKVLSDSTVCLLPVFYVCCFSHHIEDVRCHQVFQVNLQGSFCSVNKRWINRLKWHQTKRRLVRAGRSRGRRFTVRQQLALPFWHCSHTACRPQRCWSTRGSFLGCPGSSWTPDPAGQRIAAECCNAWRRANTENKCHANVVFAVKATVKLAKQLRACKNLLSRCPQYRKPHRNCSQTWEVTDLVQIYSTVAIFQTFFPFFKK